MEDNDNTMLNPSRNTDDTIPDQKDQKDETMAVAIEESQGNTDEILVDDDSNKGHDIQGDRSTRGRNYSRSPSIEHNKRRRRSHSRSREMNRGRSPKRRRGPGSFDHDGRYSSGDYRRQDERDRGWGYRSNYNRPYDDRGSSGNGNNRDNMRNAERIEPLESYKIFMMHQDDLGSPEIYQKRYEEYKKKYTLKVMRIFFNEHKNEEWLLQRYSPAIKRRAEKEELKLMAQRAKSLTERFKNGTCNISFDEDEIAKPPEGIEFDNDIEDSNRILYIRRVPCSCPISALREALEVGGEFQSIYLSDPAKKPKCEFDRSGWIVYATPEAAQAAYPKIQNCYLHDADMPTPTRLQISQHRQRGALRTPSLMSLPERIQVDLEQATTLACLFDQAYLQDLTSEVGLEAIFGIPEVSKKLETAMKKLDFTIAYLRRIHSFVYYAGQHCRGMGDILHNHPAVFYRPACTEKDYEEYQQRLSAVQDENTNTGRSVKWAAVLDSRIKALIEEYNPQKQAEKRSKEDQLVAQIEEQEEKDLESIYDQYIVPQGDSNDKQRCSLCTKLFKASEFVKKHIRNKHPEVVSETIIKTGEDSMWNQYREDEKCPMPPIEMNNTNPILDTTPRSSILGMRPRQNSFGRSSGGGGGGGSHFGRGGRQNRSRMARSMNRTTPKPDPRDLPVDPRNISKSYQDLDNMQSVKVDLNFDAIGSLPPPKKKTN